MRILHMLPAAAIAASLALGANPARAQSEDKTEASPTGKGITGGVLLGAEAVMLVEAAMKVKKPWAYAIGGIAGGIAGGVGGYFAEDSGDAKLSIYLLAGGMALAIPTTVAVLSAAAYEPPADVTEDRRPADEPVAEPPQPGAPPPPPQGAQGAKRSEPRRVAKRPAEPAVLYPAVPPALVGLSPRALTLGVPAVEVRNAYSRAELMQFGVKQATEVRVPVMSFVF
ncbi:MAG: hypothetical protein HS104_28435 [Polyangiaceae bacterium]|nr:hypothetical protein [Polyangiaceae bacterium]MCL4754778.1 hypothetical protein [Myxococcales bacterium]